MVLINGVKYACERCIRGHRVTTCTHTDQPLTMIKPKGRPATQCQHCRDQRKMKNLHTSCTCGKKGKPPGTHLASCTCHKNSHCTCSNNQGSKKTTTINGNIHHMSASERAKKKSLINAANADLKKKASELTSSESPNNIQQVQQDSQSQSQPETPYSTAYPNSNSNFVIDDIVIPFDGGNGLFDLFSHNSDSGNLTDYNSQRSTPGSTSQTNLQNGSSKNENATPNTNNDFNDTNSQYNLDSINQPTGSNINIANINTSTSNNNNNIESSERLQDNYSPNKGTITNHLSPTEIDLVDHMFPLFPLVGNQSFDNENQPLSTIPQEIAKPNKPVHHHVAPQQPKPMRPTVMTHSTSLQNGMASSVNSINSTTTSTSTANHQYQPVRLKRPESVLSIASNSSSRSYDIIGNPGYNQSTFISGSLPMSSTSAAFPPSDTFNNSNSNTTDENFDHHSSHHFGRTGLGSINTNIGTQLTKIESELYTESFFDENMDSMNVNQPNLSASSSVPNFYGVQDTNNVTNNVNGSVPDLSFVNNNDSISDFGYDKSSSVPTNPLEYDIPLYQEMFTPIIASKPFLFDPIQNEPAAQQNHSPITSQTRSSPLKQSPQGQHARP